MLSISFVDLLPQAMQAVGFLQARNMQSVHHAALIADWCFAALWRLCVAAASETSSCHPVGRRTSGST